MNGWTNESITPSIKHISATKHIASRVSTPQPTNPAQRTVQKCRHLRRPPEPSGCPGFSGTGHGRPVTQHVCGWRGEAGECLSPGACVGCPASYEGDQSPALPTETRTLHKTNITQHRHEYHATQTSHNTGRDITQHRQGHHTTQTGTSQNADITQHRQGHCTA